MTDRLAPPANAHWEPTPPVAAARALGQRVYLTGLVTILGTATTQDAARNAVATPVVRAEHVPAHIQRPNFQRGNFSSGGVWDANNAPATATTASIWMIALPVGTPVAIADRIVDEADGTPYGIIEIDDTSTDRAFLWLRASRVGIDERRVP